MKYYGFSKAWVTMIGEVDKKSIIFILNYTNK